MKKGRTKRRGVSAETMAKVRQRIFAGDGYRRAAASCGVDGKYGLLALESLIKKGCGVKNGMCLNPFDHLSVNQAAFVAHVGERRIRALIKAEILDINEPAGVLLVESGSLREFIKSPRKTGPRPSVVAT